MAATDPAPGRRTARELNELIRYTMWSVFRVRDGAALAAGPAGEMTSELVALLEQAAGKGTITRGCYDVQGLRADADFMFWWIAPSVDDLQELYARFRRTRLGRASEPVWSVVALHRPAEFNKGHIPAFLAEEAPRDYVSVYPFVRSYEWYLLEPAERRAMLAEHGMMAREYPDVRANTVACFALNDYEWILAFEADELHRIVDLMRHRRADRLAAAYSLIQCGRRNSRPSRSCIESPLSSSAFTRYTGGPSGAGSCAAWDLSRLVRMKAAVITSIWSASTKRSPSLVATTMPSNRSRSGTSSTCSRAPIPVPSLVSTGVPGRAAA